MFSLYDRKALVYGNPFVSPSNAAALRTFSFEVNRVADGNMLNSHPADFELFLLGQFDDVSGQLVPHDLGNVPLGSGLDVKLPNPVQG
ncbi:MAG: nonstructural protein [Microvirus sp.]|nr:MAG: nonstructural protein [Microvirus sp.]